jgi:hypothetical protein
MAMATVALGISARAQNTYQANAPVQSAAYTGDYVNHVGVGAELGAPVGVNAKYWLTDIWAVDGAFGWSPYSHSVGEIHVDFLAHDFDIVSLPSGRLPFYIGAGLLARFRNDGRSSLAGFRFPVGVSYMFDDCPVDIFAEIAPEAIFTPFGRACIDGSVGFRYWF